MLQMPCQQKAVLMDTYINATKFYSFAVDQLKSERASARNHAYDDVKRLSEDAHEQCRAALDALEDHASLHGC